MRARVDVVTTPIGADAAAETDRAPERTAFGLLAVLAVVLPVASLTGSPTVGVVCASATVVAGLGAAVVAWRRNGFPAIVVAAAMLGAVRVAAFHGDERASEFGRLAGWLTFADLTAAAAAIAVLAAIRVRLRRFDSRDALDAVSILAGGALLAWLTITEPLVEHHDVPPELATLVGATLPISMLALALVVDALALKTAATATSRRELARLVVVAAITALAAGLVIIHDASAWTDTIDHRVIRASAIAGFMWIAAALAHLAVPGSAAPAAPSTADGARWPAATAAPVHRAGEPSAGRARLAVIVAGFVAPAVAVAATTPGDGLDRTIRVVGAVAMVALGALRLRMALRDMDHAHGTLVSRLHRDALTGLPNREPFLRRVGDVLESTWRSDRHATVIQLDLDRFEDINDTLGHAGADRVLVAVAARLASAAQQFGGLSMAARVGGDRFAVVDGTTTSMADVTGRVETIRQLLSAPLDVGGATVFVTASIGVAVATERRTVEADELMRRSDIAAHAAKSEGRDRVAVFDDGMQARLAHRVDVERALHGAVGRGEMELHHQPIIDLVSGDLLGFEALMRWRRTDGSLTAPAEFIPVAEETGLIGELGAWAIDDALRELRGWIDAGLVDPSTTMSINVSPRQLADPAFAGIVDAAIRRSGVPAGLVWLEMTESMMLDGPDPAGSTLRELEATGVRIALDDFGTGYSSLSVLQRFPVHRIKVDRAFVRGVSDRDGDRALVRTILAMGRSLDLDVVAEGVETVHQLEALQALGCGAAQGFLISRPVPADAMRTTISALAGLADLPIFGRPDARRSATAPPEAGHAPIDRVADRARGLAVRVDGPLHPTLPH